MTSAKLRACVAMTMLALLHVGSPAAAQSLFGPGKFKIVQSDDRFSNAPTTMTFGQNNRVTKKSPVGGIYMGSYGLYLDPLVIKSRSDGAIVQLGFAVRNSTMHDTTYGAPNRLGKIANVSFLVDDNRLITARVQASEQHFEDRIFYNSIDRSASSDIDETGMITLTRDDIEALAHAKSVAIKVVGSERSWTIEAGDVAKPFVQNIRTFYDQQVLPAR